MGIRTQKIREPGAATGEPLVTSYLRDFSNQKGRDPLSRLPVPHFLSGEPSRPLCVTSV